ncbi:MAG: helix-turn-helix transcriptional regulator [Ruminococcus flavefaciens]|nr:helix-turn-helix transcriptional regulator [Ruminococcus flavefaciens]
MTNSQLITNIKSICKTQNIPLSEMLEQCNLSKGFIYDVEKRDRTPSIDKVTAIAEYFGVSLDYLLGRTNNPEVQTSNNNAIITGSNIVNGNVGNSSNVNTVSASTATLDETAEQVLNAFQGMTLADKAKVITLIAELTEKNKTA